MAGRLLLLLLCAVLAGELRAEGGVFIKKENADKFLERTKRANSFLEEMRKGNIERECNEERCSKEEAREAFEDQEKTEEFWNVYVDGDQCSSNPCHYGGHCKDGIGSYTCSCLDGYQGKNCEFVIPKYCKINNGDCEQFCSIKKSVQKDVLCSCAKGYVLAEDGKRCVSSVKYPCGKVFVKRKKRSVILPADSSNVTSDQDVPPTNATSLEEDIVTTTESPTPRPRNETSSKTPYVNIRIVGGDECLLGECPWQAVLLNEAGEEFCGGTILNENFILTAAHCMNQSKEIKVVVVIPNACKVNKGNCEQFCKTEDEGVVCSCAAGYALGNGNKTCVPVVFISADDANKVIKRQRRASSLLFEEVLQGSLERECLEERCTHEEAREVFENDEMLKMFWDAYYGGRRCSSSPCQHNGVCEDSIRGYTCTCAEGYEGENCAFAKNECRHQAKEGCHHFCYPGSNSYRCSCADGYELGKDKKQCIALDQCACGRFQDSDNLISETRKKRDKRFPWQVLLLNSEGKGFCGGVLLKSNFVLTTAECALLHSNFEIRVGAGHNGTSATEKIMQVNEKHIHIRYEEDTGENNIALLQLQEHVECNNDQLPVCIPERDFAEHILIPKLAGTVSGWRMEGDELQGDELQVSYLPAEDCKQILNISLTNRQFCGHLPEAVDKQLAGGSFLATEYKGTWFLTGILGSWPLEDTDWETFLFTKTARYMIWFKQKMK